MSIIDIKKHGAEISRFLQSGSASESREVEVRFKPLKYKGQERNFSVPYHRLKAYLEEKGYLSKEVSLRDSNYNDPSFDTKRGERSVYRISENLGENKKDMINKISSSILLDSHAVVLSYAREIKVNRLPEFLADSEPYVRMKRRTSFFIPSFSSSDEEKEEKVFAQVDLTIVDPIDFEDSKTIGTDYEIEMECLDFTKEGVEQFCLLVDTLFKVIYNTNNVYTLEDRDAIYKMLEKNFEKYRAEQIISRPIDLKFHDITYENLKNYYLTYKTDGLHKFLIFANGCTWLVFGDEVNLVLNKDLGLKDYIFDGELISDTVFQAFDCLMARGTVITSQDYIERYKQVTFIANAYKKVKSKYGSILDIVLKRVEKISKENFFSLVSDFRAKRREIGYKEDGLIFQPGGRYSQTVYKWKDPKDLTIDFRAMKGVDGIHLGMADGTNFSHEGKEFVIRDSGEIESHQIGEFEYYDGAFHLRKIRHDKLMPNKPEVVRSVWQLLMNPITEEDLTGKTLKLVFKYHNRVKSELLNNIPVGSTILDIGAGRGGDLSKMGVSNILFAVEPNKDNLDEFKSRAAKSKDKPKEIYTLLAGGEETDKIVNEINKNKKGKVDVITFMLSLTFFWSPSGRKMLDNLFETIELTASDTCTIIFMTADGDKFKELFKTKGKHLEYPGSTTVDYDEKREEVKIHIPDSIVENQTEYLFNYNIFNKRLEELGFRSVTSFFADKEELLTKEQLEFSSLYRCGIFKRTAKSQLSRRDSKEKVLSMIKPWTTEVLKWPSLKSDYVRIGCIPEGSCFIHAVLSAIYKPYQENNQRKEREEMAALLRRDLAKYLTLESKRIKGACNWEVVRDGIYPRGAMTNMMLEEKDNRFLFNQAIETLNSTEWLEEDTVALVCEVLGIDVYIVQVTKNNVYPYKTFAHKESKKKIIINYTGEHYETVGQIEGENVKTVFENIDEVIIFLNSQSEPDYIDSYKYLSIEEMYEDLVKTVFVNEKKEIVDIKVEDAFLKSRLKGIKEKIEKEKIKGRIKSPRLIR